MKSEEDLHRLISVLRQVEQDDVQVEGPVFERALAQALRVIRGKRESPYAFEREWQPVLWSCALALGFVLYIARDLGVSDVPIGGYNSFEWM